MDEKDLVRLRHIYDAAVLSLSLVSGIDRASLVQDVKLLLALSHLLGIIGEAAARTSPTTKQAMPEVPWQDMIGMRNRLVHAYFDTDPDIIWDTVTVNLKQLVEIIGPRLEH